jgi:2-amino-4-hydroxy-6-hydroxymethyldihydropteridine diphosphokinase
MTTTPWVYVALGSNLGDPPQNLLKALALLQATPGVHVRHVSPFMVTAPWGDLDQPDFLNAVAELDCAPTLSAHDFLAHCQRIEAHLGRTRHPERPYGPRTIDLDVLIYKAQSVDTPTLTVPHPRMWTRDFVLAPLQALHRQQQALIST